MAERDGFWRRKEEAEARARREILRRTLPTTPKFTTAIDTQNLHLETYIAGQWRSTIRLPCCPRDTDT
jgi:hypothetical protein